MMWPKVTLFVFYLGTTMTCMVDACQNWNELVGLVQHCRGGIFNIPILDEDITISADALRTQVAKPCSPDVLGPYKECIRNGTQSCSPEVKEAIMNEVEAYYGRCDGQNKVASWISEYVQNSFSHVEPACINYREPCDMPLRFPLIDTPIPEILRDARSNMATLFECAKEKSMTVYKNRPGCTASGPDVLFAMLLQQSGRTLLGSRMFPELITQFKQLSGV